MPFPNSPQPLTPPANSRAHSAAPTRPARDAANGVVWVFPGYGSQWTGMGRELLDDDPAFAAAVDRVEPLLRDEAGFSLRVALARCDVSAAGTAVVQPLVFAVQYCLAESWRAHGVHPAAVVGHSMGEVAAAVVAGGLDLADGVRVICRRSRLMAESLSGGGAMVVVDLPAEEVERQVAAAGGVSVAVQLSPRSTVVAGPFHKVDALAASWEAVGLRAARIVGIDVASHNRQVDPILPRLGELLARLRPGKPGVPFYSAVTNDPRLVPILDAQYWVANLRRPAYFADAVQAVAQDGFRVFLEVSPHPITGQAIEETLGAAGIGGAVIASTLRRGEPQRFTFLAQLDRLHRHGVPVDWHAARTRGGPAGPSVIAG
jgi:acyl transferase domain-containing protein